MKAAILKGPKDLSIEDIKKPVPGYGEILVKIRATAICGTDISIFEGKTEVDYFCLSLKNGNICTAYCCCPYFN